MTIAAIAWCGLLAAGGWAQQGTIAAQKQPAKTASTNADKEGERKFQQNCSRCHNAPQDLPPRVTGTVLLHMRVRAGLSEADEKAILHYMTQ